MSSLSADLLETVTACLALRLANESLRRRADHAEKTATRRLREVAAIYDIGQALAPVPNAPMLQMIVERTALLMEAQGVFPDAGGTRSKPPARCGQSRACLPTCGRKRNCSARAWQGAWPRRKKPLRIGRNVPPDPRLEGVALKAGLGSAMLVPLKELKELKDQESRILGVLCLRRRPRPKPNLPKKRVTLFGVFAAQAALALTNARLVDDLNRRAGELQKISTLSRALLSTIDLDTLLHTAVEDVCSVVGCDRCCLYWRDSNRPILVPAPAARLPGKRGPQPGETGRGRGGPGRAPPKWPCSSTVTKPSRRKKRSPCRIAR